MDVVVDVDVEDSNLHGIRRTLILAGTVPLLCEKIMRAFGLRLRHGSRNIVLQEFPFISCMFRKIRRGC